MSEQFPKFESAEKKMTMEEFLALATELSEKQEGFVFKGLEDESYAMLKAEGDEYPGFSTPIDELVAKFEAQGIKVVLGDDPKSPNAFILPLNSSDVVNDFVLPRHLKVSDDMDPKLKKIILGQKEIAKAKNKK
jgi:hypothetical protein